MCPHFFDNALDTWSNVYEVEGQKSVGNGDMVKTRTVAHEAEGNELCIGQVDNLCNKQSALVSKWQRRTQLTLVAIVWIHCGRNYERW